MNNKSLFQKCTISDQEMRGIDRFLDMADDLYLKQCRYAPKIDKPKFLQNNVLRNVIAS